MIILYYYLSEQKGQNQKTNRLFVQTQVSIVTFDSSTWNSHGDCERVETDSLISSALYFNLVTSSLIVITPRYLSATQSRSSGLRTIQSKSDICGPSSPIPPGSLVFPLLVVGYEVDSAFLCEISLPQTKSSMIKFDR